MVLAAPIVIDLRRLRPRASRVDSGQSAGAQTRTPSGGILAEQG